MQSLKVKFIGGPLDKKTRTISKGEPPRAIEVGAVCKFHNVQGRYELKGYQTRTDTEAYVSVYDWVPANEE